MAEALTARGWIERGDGRVVRVTAAGARHDEGGAGRGVPYWARPWPAGIALAERIAAAKAGAQVLASDASLDAVVFAAHCLALNEVEGEVAQAARPAGRPEPGGARDFLAAARHSFALETERGEAVSLHRLTPRPDRARGSA